VIFPRSGEAGANLINKVESGFGGHINSRLVIRIFIMT
jgi:hypothetical protein